MTNKRLEKLASLYSPEKPIAPTAVLREGGFCSKDITQLLDSGTLRKVRRGYYGWPSYMVNLDNLEVLASLIPDGVVSLFSAAQYHNLSTVIPQDIDITLPSTMRTPAIPAGLHVKVYK
jgi:predicted transcriptional regulator of viral defense system